MAYIIKNTAKIIDKSITPNVVKFSNVVQTIIANPQSKSYEINPQQRYTCYPRQLCCCNMCNRSCCLCNTNNCCCNKYNRQIDIDYIKVIFNRSKCF